MNMMHHIRTGYVVFEAFLQSDIEHNSGDWVMEIGEGVLIGTVTYCFWIRCMQIRQALSGIL